MSASRKNRKAPPREINYAPLPEVSRDFVMDFEGDVMGLVGSVGTGKTISLAIKILLAATSIVPMEDGVRRTRFIVFRKRYGDLELSIMKDLETIVAPGLIQFSGQTSPMKGWMEFSDAHGPVECELLFYAFETEADVLKIKSLKFTAGFGPEIQEHAGPRVLKGVYERLNRFPTPSASQIDFDAENIDDNPAIRWNLPDGTVAKGSFLAFDFNMPSRRHWLHDYLVKDNTVDPSTGKLFRRVYKQPSVLSWVPGGVLNNPEDGVAMRYRGEDGVFIRNLDARGYAVHNGYKYWFKLVQDSAGDDELIQRNVLVEWGQQADGKPVYPMYQEAAHVASKPLNYAPGRLVLVGVDNGHNNAWIFTQQAIDGTSVVIHEICNVGEDAKPVDRAVSEDVVPYINQHLRGYRILFVLDQAFWQEEGGFGLRQVDALTDAGLDVIPCPDKFTGPIRRINGNWLSSRRVLISPTCTRLTEALAGGFHFKMLPSGVYTEEPVKNASSHVAEAWEFVQVALEKPNVRMQNVTKKKRKRQCDVM